MGIVQIYNDLVVPPSLGLGRERCAAFIMIRKNWREQAMHMQKELVFWRLFFSHILFSWY